MAEKAATAWSAGLCDCCEDAQACCYGCWCFPCLTCTVSRRFGESFCFPLCDACTLIVPVIVPPAALSLRVAIRHRYNIKGSLVEDVLLSCCCTVCSWCQMYRELKERSAKPAVVNTNMQTVVNMQPVPVPMMMPPNPTPLVYTQPPGAVVQANAALQHINQCEDYFDCDTRRSETPHEDHHTVGCWHEE